MVNFGLDFATTFVAALVAAPSAMTEPGLEVVQAQINLGLNPASILGIVLAVAGAALYFLRNIRPELSRDHDIFFAAVGLLCGLILLSQGWRLDPILQFGQFLLAASTFFFAYESIRLRGVATEQAKRSTPIVDDERPVSKVYRAEIDEYDMMDDRPTRRRIRGSRDSRPDRPDDYEASARRPKLKGDAVDRFDADLSDRSANGDRPRKRRPKPKTSPTSSSTASTRASGSASGSGRVSTNDAPPSRSRPRPTISSFMDEEDDMATSPKPRRRPPESDTGTDYSSSRRSTGDRRSKPEDKSSDYVDYQPMNYPDEELDNSSNFD